MASKVILVDDRPTNGRYGWDWYHMATDDLSEGGLWELHDMAHRLGLQKQWLHNHPGIPHFDVPQEKKLEAIGYGAQEVSTRGAYPAMPEGRGAHQSEKDERVGSWELVEALVGSGIPDPAAGRTHDEPHVFSSPEVVPILRHAGQPSPRQAGAAAPERVADPLGGLQALPEAGPSEALLKLPPPLHSLRHPIPPESECASIILIRAAFDQRGLDSLLQIIV